MTVFILVSEAEEKLFSTIRSRCQVIRIPKIEDKDMESYLVKEGLTEEHNPAKIARLANGNYLEALEIIQNDEERTFNHNQFVLMMRNGYGSKLVRNS